MSFTKCAQACLRTAIALLVCALAVLAVAAITPAGVAHALDADVRPFQDTVHRDNVWASQTRDVFYYVSLDESGNSVVSEYDIASGRVEVVQTLPGSSWSLFYRDDALYATPSRSWWNSGANSVTVLEIDLPARTQEELFTARLDDATASCVGVDEAGRVYLGIRNGGVRVYDRSGKLLASSDVAMNIDEFYGFDESNGNFYFRGTTNWRYWGYDHYMAALKVGKLIEGGSIMYSNGEITLLYQQGFFTHHGSAAMLDARYLAELTTFSGDQLIVLDSHAVDVGEVTESATTINPVMGGVSVSDVNLPAKTVAFAAYTHDSAYADNVDTTGVGVRAAYDAGSKTLFAATSRKKLTAYSLATGKQAGTVKAVHNIYKTMFTAGGLVLLERDGDAFCVETVPVELPSTMTLDGPGQLTAGGHGTVAAQLDGTAKPSVSYSSSNKAVASVDSAGHVSAWKAGTVTITAKASNGLKATAKVQVKARKISKKHKNITALKGVKVRNVGANSYSTYGDVVESYLVETGKGLMRVQNTAKGLRVEYYGASGKVKNKKLVKREKKIFGGFFAGNGAYYVVTGAANYKESKKKGVLNVAKYTTSWKKVKAVNVKDINTTVPFDAGSCRMAEAGGKLYIHTCHKMYKSDDGLNHQANMTFTVQESNMKVVDSYSDVMNLGEGYVSHSFNQFVQTDGTYLYRIDHGDAYPRGIAYSRTPLAGALGSPDDYGCIATFSGSTGANYTGASVGGFELSCSSALTAWNYRAPTSSDVRNIRVTKVNLGSGKATTAKVTKLTKKSKVTCETPHLVKLDDYHFLLMWTQRSLKTGKGKTRFAYLDPSGKTVGKTVTKKVPLSDCQPIVLKDGSVAWYAGNGKKLKLYCIDPYKLSGMSNDAKMM